MTFEKKASQDPSINMPMSCNCGQEYDPDKSRGAWTGDQKTNSGTCGTVKA